MEAIEALISSSSSGGNKGVCKTATAHDVVLNSECCYTFHTPYTTDKGILVNMMSFMGTCEELSMLSSSSSADNDATDANPKTTRALFVRIVKKRIAKNNDDGNGNDDATAAATSTATTQPTKLGIGVDGGFQSEDDKYETVSNHSVVVMEAKATATAANQHPVVAAEVPFTEDTKASFPTVVALAADAILNHTTMTTTQAVETWQLDTDGEHTPISKFAADLPFCDNGVQISPDPADWKCQKTGDAENLWLNLSTGYVGGGRRNWDGSGGSNGALDHYEETGKKYPLVVKLGTITSNLETADCYSYAPEEDGPVKIPNLADLLQKRGIHVASMQKTVKSTAELEVELNANYAFDAITEAGSELQNVSGAGLQGLQNLGNSCYMNAVLQLLLSGTVPELAARYGVGVPSSSPSSERLKQDTELSITTNPFLTAAPNAKSAPDNLLCQTAKVGCALTSGVFAKPILDSASNSNGGDAAADTAASESDDNNPKYRLAPRMFKHVIGKDHAEFRTGEQQDAAQFLQHFLTSVDRSELAYAASQKQSPPSGSGDSNADDDRWYNASWLFNFQTTDRLECSFDGGVKYRESSAPETIWTLNLPMDKAVVNIEKDGDSGKGEAGGIIPDQKRQKSEETKDIDGSKVDGEATKEPVPTLSFASCVEHWADSHTVDDISWSHLNNAKHTAAQHTRFSNFPRFLIIQAQRYTWGADWSPVKLEVELDIPEQIDLSAYKSTGPQKGERIVSETEADGQNVGGDGASSSTPVPTASAPPLDEAALSQLMEMGFTLNGSKRALTAVGGNDLEAAMNWVFEHNSDPDFNDPLPETDTAVGASADTGVDEGVVQSLTMTLGCFTADQVRVALQECSGSADRTADWLFSHMDDIDAAIAAVQNKKAAVDAEATTSSPSSIPLDDGPGQYTMVGMVSHIGKNTGSGHYVAHLKRDSDGKWVIFNDEKVAISSQPPFKHAYMYLFQRNDTIGKAPHEKYS